MGAILAIPASFFFSPTETAPAEWGYTATVIQKARGSDQAAFSVKFHDGTSKFYLEKHPKCTQAEIDAGVEERYLKHPDVIDSRCLRLARPPEAAVALSLLCEPRTRRDA